VVTNVAAVSQEMFGGCVYYRLHIASIKKAIGIECFSLVRSTLMNRQSVHLVDIAFGHASCVKY
jgi:hypothetical protein